MSLRHALIGLLAERPASGWDLARRFEEVLGAVWPAGHPQIYGELRKLREDGLIEVESEGDAKWPDNEICETFPKGAWDTGDLSYARPLRLDSRSLFWDGDDR